jgi:sulfide:quinone oxidoreductase
MSSDRVHVVVLGAGFGGLELTSRLSEAAGIDVDITLIDRADSFVLGFSKLDVMVGRQRPDAVRSYYRDIAKDRVEFRQELVVSIDPVERHVVTDVASYDADVLVVALGADLDPSATPGFVDGGHEFYSLAGAERVRDLLPEFSSGAVVVAILGPFFKCPPAPFEAAMMLHDYLSARQVPQTAPIRVLSPMGSPIPISVEASEGILGGLNQRGIEFWPQAAVTRLDPVGKVAALADGRTIPYDLFLGVPVHRAPAVVQESGLAVDGWIPVDPATFATRFPDVYAVGDVTSAPVPRAGVFAEGEAATVADGLIARLRGESAPGPYAGMASCYVEFGDDKVARVDVDFLTGPAPTGRFQPPSAEIAAEKEVFGSSRRRRWFGAPE